MGKQPRKETVVKKSRMKTYSVTFNVWRETWGGHDQLDAQVSVEVEATSSEIAIRRAVRRHLNPGKRCSWSHEMWTTNESAVELPPVKK
jgi:hypothetical protein